jgi:magnesium transporter
VNPLATPLRTLAEGRCSPLVPGHVQSYFRDVDDHLRAVTERVTSFDELLTTLLNVTTAKVSLQQNNDMRKITAWAAIIAVPTLVVGVYGMNFDFMPELHWRYGYPIVMVVVLAVCLVLYRILKRNQWLGQSRPAGVRLLTKPLFWVVLCLVAWLLLVIADI